MAPHPPRRGRYTRGERAPRPRQAPQVNRPHAPALPAANRRWTGGAQDGANGAAASEAGQGKAGARTRAGGFPPLLSPPRTDPMAPSNPHGTSIPWWGAPETTDGRPTPDGAGGRGAAERPPHPPPPPLPHPSLRATGAILRPPGAEGTPPLPQKGPRRRGGVCGWTCTPRAPAPPAACTRPSLGAAHGGAPEQYRGPAPHDPPP